MYRKQSQDTLFQANPELFMMGEGLDPDNRWVRISRMIPWDKFEEKYADCFENKDTGRPAMPARCALGSHIIKEKFGLSDEETVELVAESPYLQYFIGQDMFSREKPFDASTMTWFRKRLTPEMIEEVNEYIIAGAMDGPQLPPDDGGGDGPPPGTPTGESGGDACAADDATPNKGTLILDATCAPVDMRFPTDVSLLNEAREKAERMVDSIYKAIGKAVKKPRTYRRRARRDYLNFARSRRRTAKSIRAQVRKQLGYLGRDIRSIKSLGVQYLSDDDREKFDVIENLHVQQQMMYETGTHRVDNRIVSLWRPYVRPIKRGKETADTEFGPKVTTSLVDGYMRVEKFSWDNYNENATLADAVENYKMKYGHYPKRILADKIFRTRDNLSYCRERGIAMNGPKLGRPPKDKSAYRQQCLLERAEAGQRNAIEGGFGVAKRRYSLGLIMMKQKETSEVQVYMTFLSMNIWRRLTKVGALFFAFVQQGLKRVDLRVLGGISGLKSGKSPTLSSFC
jgi:hypothetical protein